MDSSNDSDNSGFTETSFREGQDRGYQFCTKYEHFVDNNLTKEVTKRECKIKDDDAVPPETYRSALPADETTPCKTDYQQ